MVLFLGLFELLVRFFVCSILVWNNRMIIISGGTIPTGNFLIYANCILFDIQYANCLL